MNKDLYFYDSPQNPCCRGHKTHIKILPDGHFTDLPGVKHFEVSMLGDNGQKVGSCIVPESQIFETQTACMDYAQARIKAGVMDKLARLYKKPNISVRMTAFELEYACEQLTAFKAKMGD